jgi:hypothetical protein
MSDWYVYDWDLQGLPACFHVDLQYVEQFDTLGDFTTLLDVSGYPKKAEANTFSPREMRALDSVGKECVKILGAQCAFVGWIDIEAQRRYYFYTSDARLLVPLMAYCSEETSSVSSALKPRSRIVRRITVCSCRTRQSGSPWTTRRISLRCVPAGMIAAPTAA